MRDQRPSVCILIYLYLGQENKIRSFSGFLIQKSMRDARFYFYFYFGPTHLITGMPTVNNYFLFNTVSKRSGECLESLRRFVY